MHNPFEKTLDRKLFQKKFDQKRKPFEKRFDRKASGTGNAGKCIEAIE
ncbi:MAG: hypothetical protein PHH67_08500 [Methanosarcina sp.]|nr:hypothetical protein [Methanosarcina sp.]MDD4306530.1 hypothetical protein [Methanosarcina sp.]MDD4619995.1 hypothetical protein [Methanosarcina sp.]